MKYLTITKSPGGRKLKQPLMLKLAEPKDAAEEKLQQYVIDTFAARHPA